MLPMINDTSEGILFSSLYPHIFPCMTFGILNILFSALTVMSINSYGSHPLQKYKVFQYKSTYERLIVCIHGGAWRDPNNTFDDFDLFARYSRLYQVNVFLVNYRLSPEVKHPEHLLDVEMAVLDIQTRYPVADTYLVGHSVGATFILQLLCYEQLFGKTSPIDVSICFMLDGIYAIPALIDRYPDYRGFVEEAFDGVDYAKASVPVICPKNQSIHMLILHSVNDELLDDTQGQQLMRNMTENNNYSFQTGNYGSHNNVYCHEDVFATIIDRINPDLN